MTVLGIFYAVPLTDCTSPTPKQKHLFKRKLRRLLNLHLMDAFIVCCFKSATAIAFCFFSFLRGERPDASMRHEILLQLAANEENSLSAFTSVFSVASCGRVAMALTKIKEMVTST